jgi:hypothetical protein
MIGITFGIVAFAIIAVPETASAQSTEHLYCTPDYVMDVDGSDFIRVRCEETLTVNGNSVRYFVTSTTNAERAARFVSIATSSMLSGIKFYLEVLIDGSNNPSDCSVSNCRYAEKFAIIR